MHISKKNLVRILVSFVIVIVIIGLWLVKNHGAENIAELDGQGSVAKAPTNPDFALDVTEPLDLDRLKSYGLPILLDFGADSCAPCKEMAPILKDLNARLQGKAIIRFIDVWKYPELANGFPIRVIPTQMFFDMEGKPYVPSDPSDSQLLMYIHKDTEEHLFTAHEGGMTEAMIMEALGEMGLHND
ncbi:MAG: thioredoxin family protein [Sphaerochaeta sp.]|jgi:thioredoxin 1|nr:thioredoxin family protein [Sphaerochaeta sp.]PKL29387.1 MAG: thioredoxin [Spirochaetae bacterium HGW-Spirochaetae-2]